MAFGAPSPRPIAGLVIRGIKSEEGNMGGEGHYLPEQTHLNELAKRCAIFINYYGKILRFQKYKLSAVLTCLAMTYESRGLTIEFNTVSSYPHFSGTCMVTVRNKNLLVLKATGSFARQKKQQFSTVYRIIATTYIPGNWEKKIRVLPQMK